MAYRGGYGSATHVDEMRRRCPKCWKQMEELDPGSWTTQSKFHCNICNQDYDVQSFYQFCATVGKVWWKGVKILSGSGK
jgi:hypothetical protein